MAELTYNGIKIQLMRTQQYASKAVYSQDGVDYLFTEHKIEVFGVLYLQADPPFAPLKGPIGSRFATMDDLRSALLQPRKQLVYEILSPGAAGGTKRRLVAPQDPKSPCDCNNGPRPDYCYITQIAGDKTALVSYGITCWTNDCSKVVLSNRWTVTGAVDQDRYTTRTMQGRLELRADLMRQKNLHPDLFREMLFLPIPLNFIRKDIQVTVTSDGRAAEYTVVDQEVPLNIPDAWRVVTRVEGNVTAGSEVPIKNVNDLGGKVGDIVGNALSLDIGGTMKAAQGLLLGSIPVNKACGIVRVWGNRYAQRSQLAYVAKQIILDRFAPLGAGLNIAGLNVGRGIFLPVSAYLTCDIAQRFVELRMELFPGVNALLTAFVQDMTAFESMLNLNDNEIRTLQGFTAGDGKSAPGTNPLPNPEVGSATRGSYLGALLVQALGGECQLPAAPPDSNQSIVNPPPLQ